MTISVRIDLESCPSAVITEGGVLLSVDSFRVWMTKAAARQLIDELKRVLCLEITGVRAKAIDICLAIDEITRVDAPPNTLSRIHRLAKEIAGDD